MRGGRWPRFGEAAGGIGLLIVHAFFGGVAALVVGEATLIRQAIVFGLAWPTVLNVALGAFKAAQPRRGRSDSQSGSDGNDVGLPPGDS